MQSQQIIKRYSQWGSAREALKNWKSQNCLKVNLSYEEQKEKAILEAAAKEEEKQLNKEKQNPPMRCGYLKDYINQINSDPYASRDEKYLDLWEKTLTRNAQSIIIHTIDFPYDFSTNKKAYPNIFTIPSSYQGFPVVAFFGQMATYEWSEYADWYDPNDILEDVTVQEGIIMIGSSAFHECVSLANVSLPSSLKVIGREAFSGCKSIKSIILPDCLESMEIGAFEYCENLKSIVIPSKLKMIDANCFFATGLERVSIPGNVTCIGHSAFAWCKNLKSVSISEGVREIKDHAFDRSYALSRIVFPKSLTDISDKIFLDQFASSTDQKDENEIVNPTVYCYKGTEGYFFAMDHNMKVELLD